MYSYCDVSMHSYWRRPGAEGVLVAYLLCQLYSKCIPIGERRRDGIMICRCKLIVLIKRFYCNPLRGGRRENGEGNSYCIIVVLVFYSYPIPVWRGGREVKRNSDCMIMVCPCRCNCIRIGEKRESGRKYYCIRTAFILWPCCIPIGGGGREGRRICCCIRGVYLLRFDCSTIWRGGREEGRNSHCIAMAFAL